MNLQTVFLNFFSKRFMLLGLLIVSLTLSACSTRWAYNQLDWVVPWYLDDYVVLNEYQEPEFEASLTDWLNWHRSTQLNQYAALLADIKQDIQTGLTANDINDYSNQVDLFLQNAFTKMGNDFVPMVQGLSIEQKQELLVNLGEKAEEYAEKNVLIGEKESREKTQDKMLDFMQDLLGDLSEQQIKLINNWAQQKPWLAPLFYQNRLNWQGYLTQQFEQELFDKAALMALFKDRKMLWSPAYKTQMQINRQAFNDLMLALSNSLTVQQKNHLSIELDGYIEDLEYLAQSK